MQAQRLVKKLETVYGHFNHEMIVLAVAIIKIK